jgi:hypothetical protein
MIAGMTSSAKEQRDWVNRPASEMVMGLAEWLKVKREAGKDAEVPLVAVDAPLRFISPGSGRASHVFGSMNGLEKRYNAHLQLRFHLGELTDFRFEPLKLRLAPATFFNPDFLLVLPNSTHELHEVKGHWEDDARVKIKVAATLFPWWKFVGVTWNKEMKDWKFEDFKA